MRTILLLRSDMLELVKTALNALAPGPALPELRYKSIVFKNVTNDDLCYIPFNDLESASSGDDAIYKFKAADGSFVLQAGAIAPGTVTQFEIWGDRGAGAEVVLSGTVGTSQNHDITISRVNWTLDTFVTLTEFGIRIRQGS